MEPSVAYRIDTPEGAVVISGDTRVCDEVQAQCRREPAGTRSNPRPSAGVPRLALTHLIPPPSDGGAGFVEDIRAGGCVGEVTVCNDLDRFVLGGV